MAAFDNTRRRSCLRTMPHRRLLFDNRIWPRFFFNDNRRVVDGIVCGIPAMNRLIKVFRRIGWLSVANQRYISLSVGASWDVESQAELSKLCVGISWMWTMSQWWSRFQSGKSPLRARDVVCTSKLCLFPNVYYVEFWCRRWFRGKGSAAAPCLLPTNRLPKSPPPSKIAVPQMVDGLWHR